MMMDMVVDLLAATSTELILFGVAFALQFFLFGNVYWPCSKRASKQGTKKFPGSSDDSGDEKHALSASAFESVQHAYETGNRRAVLHHWQQLKQSKDEVPADIMAIVIECLQCSRKESKAILAEVSSVLLKKRLARSIDYMNRVLEPVCRSLDCQLADGITQLFPSLGVNADAKTYELLVHMHFATRSFEEVTKLKKQMGDKGIQPTTRTRVAFLKTAIASNDFDQSVRYMREIPVESIPSNVSERLLDLACREKQLKSILPDLEAGRMRLSVESLNAALVECGRVRDDTLTTQVLALASRQDVNKNSRTCSLLIRVAGDNSEQILQILDEISTSKFGDDCFDLQVASAVLKACASTSDLSLSEKLANLVTVGHAGHLPISLALIRFYAEHGHAEKACKMYEEQVKGVSAGGQRSQLDARTMKSLLSACHSCGRKDLTEALLEADADSQVDTFKSLMRCRDFEGVLRTFDSCDRSKAPTAAYNLALQSCVELEAFDRAKNLLNDMISAGKIDAGSFNTILKAKIKIGDMQAVCAIVQQMKEARCTPNNTTFNDLAGYLIGCARATQRNAAWEAMDMLISMGGNATRNGCTQIFKHLKNTSGNAELARSMKLLDHLGEPINDGLLACAVEACIRLGKKQALAQKLELLKGDEPVKISSAHNFGSIIKGYSFIGDADGAWHCWKNMCSQHITPTSITIGCMVEAVASNGDVDGAHELVLDLLDKTETRPQINAIIFGSVLKGYGRAGRMEQLWSTFEEMKQHKVEPSLMTFNALLDACARNKQLENVPAVIMEMKIRGMKPNIVTHSTLIKAFCAVGDMTSAFGILEDLRKSENKPDEVVYNTMIDGCLQAGLVNEGEQMIEAMMSEGVAPSNYTLSVLVRLLGQSGRIDRAVEMVERATAEFQFKLNIYVYSALVQACINSKDYSYAVSCYAKAARDRISVDAKTCRHLIRGLVNIGRMELATDLLRNMLGLDENKRKGCSPANVLLEDAFLSEFFNALVGEVKKGSGRAASSSVAPKLYAEIKDLKPNVRLESSVIRKITGSA